MKSIKKKSVRVRRSPKKSIKKSQKLKLVSIKKSTRPEKKYMATFNDGTVTHFGAAGMQNYGGVGNERHLSKERKKRYLSRHRKRENWNDPKSAGALSRWILWNKESLRASITDYKKRFNL